MSKFHFHRLRKTCVVIRSWVSSFLVFVSYVKDYQLSVCLYYLSPKGLKRSVERMFKNNHSDQGHNPLMLGTSAHRYQTMEPFPRPGKAGQPSGLWVDKWSPPTGFPEPSKTWSGTIPGHLRDRNRYPFSLLHLVEAALTIQMVWFFYYVTYCHYLQPCGVRVTILNKCFLVFISICLV